MDLDLRIRLSVMMFLQYLVWGAWATVGNTFFEAQGFSPGQIGWLFGALYLACIVSPFIGGQIVDRYFATQYFLGVAHLLGGVFLLLIARETDFTKTMTYMMIYSLLYAPTLPLTNSICFHHVKDPAKDFGGLRVWGTLGWIAAGALLTGLRRYVASDIRGDLFYLAGGASLALGLFCFALPHTPPKKEAENPFAFIEAIKLLKDKNFLIFFLISFVVTTELQFYYIPTSSFLQHIGISGDDVPLVMTTAQIAEILTMAVLLPIVMAKLGIRKTLAIGVIAWPIRYLVFAMGGPVWAVVASLTLHGLGYTFFFVVSQIYVDNVAPSNIRASAQSLLTIATLGIGNFLGTQFYAIIKTMWTSADGKTVEWTKLFLVPCGLTVACAIAFLLFFKPSPSATATPGGVSHG